MKEIIDWAKKSKINRCLEIELTNYCSLSCVVCPRKQLKKIGFLSFENFVNIVDFVIDWDYKQVSICWFGDAFMHKEFNKFIDYFFLKLPDVSLNIITKWQSITDIHLNKINELTKKWYKISLAFSFFSLKKQLHNQLVWWDSYDSLIEAVQKCDKLNINYSLEFLLTVLTVNEFNSFLQFAKKLNKASWWAIVHNWWWSINKEVFDKLFSQELFSNELYKDYYIERRSKEEKCEVIRYDYFSIDYEGKIHQCLLNRLSKDTYLWKVWNCNYNEIIKKSRELDYKTTCKDCYYLSHELFL